MKLIATFLAVACGCTGGRGDSAVSDAQGGSGSGSGSDGGSGGETVGDVTCVASTHTQSNASGKIESKSYFALLDGYKPTDDVLIETCYAVAPPTSCPAGYTCTDTGATPPGTAPGGQLCYWTRPTAFTEGKLYVFCGYVITSYDMNGAVTSTNDARYASIRIHHY